MKKVLLILTMMFSINIFAHTLILDVKEHPTEKGVLYIKGSSDTGESVVGEEIYLLSDIPYDGDEEVFQEDGGEDFLGKLILFKGKLNENEELIVPKPASKKYIVLMFGGVDHLADKKGYNLTEDEKADWEMALVKYKEVIKDYENLLKAKKF